MTLSENIQTGAKALGISEKDGLAGQLEKFLLLLSRWNRVSNLTGIKYLNEMVSAHLMDSLSVWPFITGKTVLDVGSGAGFPGIPLAILYPKKSFTLLDSNGKKTRFIRQAVIDLKLTNVEVIHARVETLETKFDHVICRAFGSLELFVSMCEQHTEKGGNLLAMKSNKTENLGGREMNVHKLSVPGVESERYLMLIPAD